MPFVGEKAPGNFHSQALRPVIRRSAIPELSPWSCRGTASVDFDPSPLIERLLLKPEGDVEERSGVFGGSETLRRGCVECPSVKRW
jgi:hypothetical protein